ncbi:hypothetical protein DPMN_072682 [Dreissena polymorpha]|uniref:Uncharacterized protein n=1 Tax=Dreissena polymorpha TaxID=45954 RepID=A0A9D4BXQ8_DREPO|nr:hypothetical protein DPMN_072682 [Dreissena polymorpha]
MNVRTGPSNQGTCSHPMNGYHSLIATVLRHEYCLQNTVSPEDDVKNLVGPCQANLL